MFNLIIRAIHSPYKRYKHIKFVSSNYTSPRILRTDFKSKASGTYQKKQAAKSHTSSSHQRKDTRFVKDTHHGG